MAASDSAGSSTSASQWVTRQRPNPQAALRLFCFPYAGGSTHIYRNWAEHLPAKIEVCAVQLPGRGNRLREAPFTRMDSLVREAAKEIAPLTDKPFAIFGHSMGAVIGFELARLLRREYATEPVRLFASGRIAPQISRDDKQTYSLPEQEFIAELRRLNGTPKEVLEHPELMQVMTPVLRADFEVTQTYEYRSEPPLGCPISAMGGLRDTDVPREDLQAWREQTTGAFSLRMFPGGHFFINTDGALLLQAVARELYQSGVLGEASRNYAG
ncbi:MAG TPA: thioesterase II family protein [Pyrinomonadaceae bacterium]|jgi:medium-chain acyl-[acyl-carrier-protein] hydrolase